MEFLVLGVSSWLLSVSLEKILGSARLLEVFESMRSLIRGSAWKLCSLSTTVEHCVRVCSVLSVSYFSSEGSVRS